jgi:hypothetical protein
MKIVVRNLSLRPAKEVSKQCISKVMWSSSIASSSIVSLSATCAPLKGRKKGHSRLILHVFSRSHNIQKPVAVHGSIRSITDKVITLWTASARSDAQPLRPLLAKALLF